jgi:cell division protein FtsB
VKKVKLANVPQVNSNIQSRRAPRRSLIRIRYVAVLGVFGWAVFHYWYVQSPQLAQLTLKQKHMESQLHTMNQQAQNLKTQINELNSNSFILGYASRHYNVILPGQVAFDVKH